MADVIEIADVPQSTFARCFLGDHRAKQEDQEADFLALGSLVHYMIHNCSDDVSNELVQFGKALADGSMCTMNKIIASLGTRVFEYMTLCQTQKGILETELAKEIDNGRLFRVLYRFFDKVGKYDEQFSGTDGAQALQMFKNYLLSRKTMYEVVSGLNKLDAGVREKIRLESFAESTVKFVSYAELRQIMEDDQFMTSPFFYPLSVFNDSGLMG
ncbi:PAN2-PAN3 deadenylation complex subunit pan3 [Galendromus occidentalis]|uniref:PAN2-PAN3 deadenylation complex subunit pan3 n=1 Tax=Galendromus occidentalis TaxID=34638 RepID=A0AAJ6QLS1_9ACAR|nr:PAN2-PAN3 deadenylation complex subunit pan3 [Galendromus occidentalis]